MRVAKKAPSKLSVPELEAFFERYRGDPILFVREQFDVEPDEWQRDALLSVVRSPRIAMSACKGPGKSCLLAWVIWWFLVTHTDGQVIAISITSDNLKDNLWKELSAWQAKSRLLTRMFTVTGERIVSTEKKHEKTWWCSARSFAKSADVTQQANTLAGFHAKNVMIVLDEVGDYPPGVLPAAEAIFAVKGQNAKLVVAGNPTSTQGPLYSIVSRPQGWVVIRITGDPDDPKRSPRISKAWAQAEIDRWGRDNPYVKVNILGEFPPAGADQLIIVDAVMQGMKRDLPALAYRSDPIIWGIDPSRSDRRGADEAACARRQGVLMRTFENYTWRGLNGPKLAIEIGKRLLESEKLGESPDAIFIDVGGVGASVVDHLGLLGWEDIIVPVDFGGGADDSRFIDKRSEMWWLLSEWVHSPTCCLPNDIILQEELVAPRYRYVVQGKRTGFKLESKEAMKERGVRSPNRADAGCLTFAAPVAAKGRAARERENAGRSVRATTEYDPYARS